MSRIRSVIGGSIGNLVEWYDFYVYSFFSLYFAKAFFPGGDATAQLLNAAGIFALGFLMRPVGGFVMGAYADRVGRRAALTLSVLLMCGGSLVIALCPTFAMAGVWAPVILVAARLLQGVSLGGEYGASATYLSEIASPGNRGFTSSFQYVTLVGGQLLASLTLLAMQWMLDRPALEAWGWRVPFAIGAALSVVAVWLRRGIAETEAFRAVAAPRQPLSDLWKHRRSASIVAGLTAGGTLAFYTYTTYLPKLLVNSAGLTREQASVVSVVTLFLFACLQPVVGALSDRIGRRPLLIAFGVCGMLATVPILSALRVSEGPAVAIILALAALAIVSLYTSINAVVKAELFPAEVRALGVAFPYAVTVSIFGGSAEYVALWFKGAGREDWFDWYVTGCIAVSLVVYVRMRDTRRTSLIDGIRPQ